MYFLSVLITEEGVISLFGPIMMEQTGSEVVTFCEYFIMDVSGQICKKFCIPCWYFIIHSVFETVRDKDFYIITSCMMGVRPAVFCCRRPGFFKQIMPQFRCTRHTRIAAWYNFYVG